MARAFFFDVGAGGGVGARDGDFLSGGREEGFFALGKGCGAFLGKACSPVLAGGNLMDWERVGLTRDHPFEGF